MDLKIKETKEGILVQCRITPRASKTKIKGIRNGALAISLKAPPVDGKANEELIKFISKALRIPKSAIALTKGEHGRDKTLMIHNVKYKDIIQLIN